MICDFNLSNHTIQSCEIGDCASVTIVVGSFLHFISSALSCDIQSPYYEPPSTRGLKFLQVGKFHSGHSTVLAIDHGYYIFL